MQVRAILRNIMNRSSDSGATPFVGRSRRLGDGGGLKLIAGLVMLASSPGLFGASRVNEGDPPDSAGAQANGARYKDPVVDLKVFPQMRPAFVRAEFLDNTPAEAFYKRVNFRGKIDTLPKRLRVWENGFNESLKDGGVPLSRKAIEAAREASALYAYHDARSNFHNIRAGILALPIDQQGPALAEKLFEVAKHSLSNTCGLHDPSPELMQYIYANFVAHWVMRWGYYDEDKGNSYRDQKRDITVNDILKDFGVQCESAAMAHMIIVNHGVKIRPELRCLKGLAAGGAWLILNPAKVGGHAINFIEIGKTQIMFDATPFDAQTARNPAIWSLARRMHSIGPLDEISTASLTVALAPAYEGSYESVKGEIEARPWCGLRLGQVWMGRLDLGNMDRTLPDGKREQLAHAYMRASAPNFERYMKGIAPFICP